MEFRSYLNLSVYRVTMLISISPWFGSTTKMSIPGCANQMAHWKFIIIYRSDHSMNLRVL